MRLLATFTALCLGASSLIRPAAAADDIIVNGLHCNALCQSWLGTGGASAAPPVRAEPAVARPVLAAVEPMVPPLSVLTPMQIAPRPMVRTASREVNVAPEEAAAVSVPALARREAIPATPPLSPVGASSRRVNAAVPLIKPSRLALPASAPQRAASVDQPRPQLSDLQPDAFEGASADDRSAANRPQKRRKPVAAEARMEPGLTTLPHMSDLVAVHGTIMVETAEDRALARRDMAKLVKATTRPKQFRTGYANPLSDQPAVDHQLVGQAH